MPPMPTEWWLRPVSRAWRVGEHSAVVWKRLYFSPAAASFSKAGVLHGPPKALEAPKPTSSSRTIRTLAPPPAGRSGSIGGKVAFGSFASNADGPGRRCCGMGRTARWMASGWSTMGLTSRCARRGGRARRSSRGGAAAHIRPAGEVAGTGLVYCVAVSPPSSVSTWPVTKAEASEQKKRTAPTRSSVSAMRCSGMRA